MHSYLKFGVRNSAFDIFLRLFFFYKDGNAYDFPQSTLFEIGLLEGCSTGKILSPDGQLEDYFESVQGPLRFVVSDTPEEADTLTKLRVGVPDAADTMYLTYADDIFQSKTMPEENSNLTLAQKSSDELKNVFCVALFNNPGHGVAQGRIEGETCDEYSCDNSMDLFTAPKFDLNIILPENYTKYNFCKFETRIGITHPLFDNEFLNIKDEFVNEYVFDICFDKLSGNWKNTIEGGSIVFNVVSGPCENNLMERFKLIRNKEDLSNIPKDEIPLAIQHFKKQLIYGSPPETDGEYRIYEVTIIHENIHVENFDSLIIKTLEDKSTENLFNELSSYKDAFSLIEAECTVPINYKLIKSKSKENFDIVLNSFINRLDDLYELNKGEENENRTHSHESISELIADYIAILEKNR